jgi:hypothetical protein
LALHVGHDRGDRAVPAQHVAQGGDLNGEPVALGAAAVRVGYGHPVLMNGDILVLNFTSTLLVDLQATVAAIDAAGLHPDYLDKYISS